MCSRKLDYESASPRHFFGNGLVKRIHTTVTCAIVLAAVLLLAHPAAAHLSAEPSFLPVGGKQRIALTVHNDRDETMTGFRLTAPEGIRILGTGGGSGWNELVEGASARWSGGSLAPDTPVVFEIDVEAVTTEPGTVDLAGDQLYPGGDSVNWEVSLTVVPPGAGPPADEDGMLATAIVTVAVVGALALVVAAFLYRRRHREGM
jgi:hypothetical protein